MLEYNNIYHIEGTKNNEDLVSLNLSNLFFIIKNIIGFN
jgi:hypothetical protein